MDAKKPGRRKASSSKGAPSRPVRARAARSSSKGSGGDDYDGSVGTSGTGWTGLADLSEFEFDADIDSDMSEEDVELMLVAAMVSGADQLEVMVTAEIEGDGEPSAGAGAGAAASSAASGSMLPDELFTELLVAAANKNASGTGADAGGRSSQKRKRSSNPRLITADAGAPPAGSGENPGPSRPAAVASAGGAGSGSSHAQGANTHAHGTARVLPAGTQLSLVLDGETLRERSRSRSNSLSQTHPPVHTGHGEAQVAGHSLPGDTAGAVAVPDPSVGMAHKSGLSLQMALLAQLQAAASAPEGHTSVLLAQYAPSSSPLSLGQGSASSQAGLGLGMECPMPSPPVLPARVDGRERSASIGLPWQGMGLHAPPTATVPLATLRMRASSSSDNLTNLDHALVLDDGVGRSSMDLGALPGPVSAGGGRVKLKVRSVRPLWADGTPAGPALIAGPGVSTMFAAAGMLAGVGGVPESRRSSGSAEPVSTASVGPTAYKRTRQYDDAGRTASQGRTIAPSCGRSRSGSIADLLDASSTGAVHLYAGQAHVSGKRRRMRLESDTVLGGGLGLGIGDDRAEHEWSDRYVGDVGEGVDDELWGDLLATAPGHTHRGAGSSVDTEGPHAEVYAEGEGEVEVQGEGRPDRRVERERARAASSSAAAARKAASARAAVRSASARASAQAARTAYLASNPLPQPAKPLPPGFGVSRWLSGMREARADEAGYEYTGSAYGTSGAAGGRVVGRGKGSVAQGGGGQGSRALARLRVRGLDMLRLLGAAPGQGGGGAFLPAELAGEGGVEGGGVPLVWRPAISMPMPAHASGMAREAVPGSAHEPYAESSAGAGPSTSAANDASPPPPPPPPAVLDASAMSMVFVRERGNVYDKMAACGEEGEEGTRGLHVCASTGGGVDAEEEPWDGISDEQLYCDCDSDEDAEGEARTSTPSLGSYADTAAREQLDLALLESMYWRLACRGSHRARTLTSALYRAEATAASEGGGGVHRWADPLLHGQAGLRRALSSPAASSSSIPITASASTLVGLPLPPGTGGGELPLHSFGRRVLRPGAWPLSMASSSSGMDAPPPLPPFGTLPSMTSTGLPLPLSAFGLVQPSWDDVRADVRDLAAMRLGELRRGTLAVTGAGGGEAATPRYAAVASSLLRLDFGLAVAGWGGDPDPSVLNGLSSAMASSAGAGGAVHTDVAAVLAATLPVDQDDALSDDRSFGSYAEFAADRDWADEDGEWGEGGDGVDSSAVLGAMLKGVLRGREDVGEEDEGGGTRPPPPAPHVPRTPAPSAVQQAKDGDAGLFAGLHSLFSSLPPPAAPHSGPQAGGGEASVLAALHVIRALGMGRGGTSRTADDDEYGEGAGDVQLDSSLLTPYKGVRLDLLLRWHAAALLERKKGAEERAAGVGVGLAGVPFVHGLPLPAGLQGLGLVVGGAGGGQLRDGPPVPAPPVHAPTAAAMLADEAAWSRAWTGAEEEAGVLGAVFPDASRLAAARSHAVLRHMNERMPPGCVLLRPGEFRAPGPAAAERFPMLLPVAAGKPLPEPEAAGPAPPARTCLATVHSAWSSVTVRTVRTAAPGSAPPPALARADDEGESDGCDDGEPIPLPGPEPARCGIPGFSYVLIPHGVRGDGIHRLFLRPVLVGHPLYAAFAAQLALASTRIRRSAFVAHQQAKKAGGGSAMALQAPPQSSVVAGRKRGAGLVPGAATALLPVAEGANAPLPPPTTTAMPPESQGAVQEGDRGQAGAAPSVPVLPPRPTPYPILPLPAVLPMELSDVPQPHARRPLPILLRPASAGTPTLVHTVAVPIAPTVAQGSGKPRTLLVTTAAPLPSWAVARMAEGRRAAKAGRSAGRPVHVSAAMEGARVRGMAQGTLPLTRHVAPALAADLRQAALVGAGGGVTSPLSLLRFPLFRWLQERQLSDSRLRAVVAARAPRLVAGHTVSLVKTTGGAAITRDGRVRIRGRLVSRAAVEDMRALGLPIVAALPVLRFLAARSLAAVGAVGPAMALIDACVHRYSNRLLTGEEREKVRDKLVGKTAGPVVAPPRPVHAAPAPPRATSRKSGVGYAYILEGGEGDEGQVGVRGRGLGVPGGTGGSGAVSDGSEVDEDGEGEEGENEEEGEGEPEEEEEGEGEEEGEPGTHTGRPHRNIVKRALAARANLARHREEARLARLEKAAEREKQARAVEEEERAAARKAARAASRARSRAGAGKRGGGETAGAPAPSEPGVKRASRAKTVAAAPRAGGGGEGKAAHVSAPSKPKGGRVGSERVEHPPSKRRRGGEGATGPRSGMARGISFGSHSSGTSHGGAVRRAALVDLPSDGEEEEDANPSEEEDEKMDGQGDPTEAGGEGEGEGAYEEEGEDEALLLGGDSESESGQLQELVTGRGEDGEEGEEEDTHTLALPGGLRLGRLPSYDSGSGLPFAALGSHSSGGAPFGHGTRARSGSTAAQNTGSGIQRASYDYDY